MKISKLTIFKGTVHIFLKFQSVLVMSVSRNFGQFQKVVFPEIPVNFAKYRIIFEKKSEFLYSEVLQII